MSTFFAWNPLSPFPSSVRPQGGRAVLCLYGYSNQQPDGLSFPDVVVEPDIEKVAAVTLEVMSLRMELDMLIKVWTNGIVSKTVILKYFRGSWNQLFYWVVDVFTGSSPPSRVLWENDPITEPKGIFPFPFSHNLSSSSLPSTCFLVHPNSLSLLQTVFVFVWFCVCWCPLPSDDWNLLYDSRMTLDRCLMR